VRIKGQTDSFESVDKIVEGLKGGSCFTNVERGPARQSGAKVGWSVNVDVDCAAKAAAAPAAPAVAGEEAEATKPRPAPAARSAPVGKTPPGVKMPGKRGARKAPAKRPPKPPPRKRPGKEG